MDLSLFNGLVGSFRLAVVVVLSMMFQVDFRCWGPPIFEGKTRIPFRRWTGQLPFSHVSYQFLRQRHMPLGIIFWRPEDRLSILDFLKLSIDEEFFIVERKVWPSESKSLAMPQSGHAQQCKMVLAYNSSAALMSVRTSEGA